MLANFNMNQQTPDFNEFVHCRKKNKDEKIKEEVKKKKKEGLDNIMKEEEEKYERSIQCAERYQAWVEKKGKPQRGPLPPTLTQRYMYTTSHKRNLH